jgi:hypothetical protein
MGGFVLRFLFHTLRGRYWKRETKLRGEHTLYLF